MHLNCIAYFLILINKTVVLAFPFEHVFPSKYQSLLSKGPQAKLSERRTKILKTKNYTIHSQSGLLVFLCYFSSVPSAEFEHLKIVILK